MSTIIAGTIIACLGGYIWYYCHRIEWLEAAAKRLLIHRAGLIAMREAERLAGQQSVRLEAGQ